MYFKSFEINWIYSNTIIYEFTKICESLNKSLKYINIIKINLRIYKNYKQNFMDFRPCVVRDFTWLKDGFWDPTQDLRILSKI